MKLNFSAWTISRNFSKVVSRAHGFSLIETLIGSALILTNLGVLSSALVQYGEVSKKQRAITLAMNLESALHRAVSDPARYDYASGMTIDQMVQAGGNFPNPFTLVVPVDLEGASVDVTLTWPLGFNNTADTLSVYLNRQMVTCADFTDKNCVILLEVAKTKTAGVSPIYSFAYRITINPELQIAMQSLGIGEKGPFTTDRGAGNSDYKLYIPQYILASENFTLCNNTTTIGLTGYNRNTGAPVCLVAPTNVAAERCDSNEIAKGLRVFNDLTNFHIVPRCVTARGYTCPPPNSNNDAGQIEYSMMIFDPRSLDPSFAAGAVNKCVFTAMSPATDPTPPSAVNALNVLQACPNPYYITNANPYGCTASGVVTVINGSCTWCAAFDTNFPYGCIDPRTETFPSSGHTISAVPVFSGANVVGANCTLVDTTGPMGHASCTSPGSSPTISGTITMNATCNLKPGTPMILDATAE